MKRDHLHALADGAYQLLGGVEAAERDPKQYDEAELRRLLEPLLRAAMPLYTTEVIEQLHAEAALAQHGGNMLQAARAIGTSRPTLKRRARSAA